MTRRTLAAAAAVALAGCGLLDPPGPPARVVGDSGPAAETPVPVPRADPDAPIGVTAPPPFPGYQLVWHDEFDSAALDESRWNVDTGPWRNGLNARDALVVNGGLLSLVTFTDASGVHHSGHINTHGHFDPTYGYFEARVRFLDSVGQWCSFFLFTEDIVNRPPGDPGTAGVEIDVFEHRDVDDGGWDLRNMIQVGLNWDGFGKEWKKVNRMLAHPDGAALSHAWHTYAALWTDSAVTFYIDDRPIWTTSAAISHRSQPIYLSCEVLDGSWAGSIPAGGYGTREASTTRMEVDWVRAWQPTR
jgi:beta-glucanase (GH16 family)